MYAQNCVKGLYSDVNNAPHVTISKRSAVP